MRTLVSALLLLLCILIVPRLDAQSPHAAGPAAIDRALAQHANQRDSDRVVIERLLERPDVRAIAAEAGLDVRRAQSAVATLDADQLAQLATQARTAEQALSGGQRNVTVSTTLIIIVMLVVILLIVALK